MDDATITDADIRWARDEWLRARPGAQRTGREYDFYLGLVHAQAQHVAEQFRTSRSSQDSPRPE